MIIFVVVDEVPYEGYQILKAFTDKAKAEAYRDMCVRDGTIPAQNEGFVLEIEVE